MSLRLFIIAAILCLFAAGCKEEVKFKKTKGGLEYSIYKGNSGKKINYKDVVRISATRYYEDSLLTSPYDHIQQFIDVDSSVMTVDLVDMLLESKVGDSIVTRVLVDSAFKYGPKPDYAKSGKYLGFRIKILEVIKDTAEAARLKEQQKMQVREVDQAEQVSQDDKVLKAYISSQKAEVVKTDRGVYVEIKEAGSGPAIDSGKTISVDYKGYTLNGNVFDQSYDANGKSVKPFTFTIGKRGVIPGWDNGLRLFKKGGKGRLFIPSGMAYGPVGSPPVIQPNECLVFDIEVKDVK